MLGSSWRSPRAARGRVLAAVLLLPALLAATPQGERKVEVRVNGRHLAWGVSTTGAQQREEILVPVAALVRAVDGPAPRRPSHFRLSGAALYAAAEGGCDSCIVRVRRPVLISRAVRPVAGEPHLPLTELVRAFEGRLSSDGAGVYTIFAGDCTWCVLEPR